MVLVYPIYKYLGLQYSFKADKQWAIQMSRSRWNQENVKNKAHGHSKTLCFLNIILSTFLYIKPRAHNFYQTCRPGQWDQKEEIWTYFGLVGKEKYKNEHIWELISNFIQQANFVINFFNADKLNDTNQNLLSKFLSLFNFINATQYIHCIIFTIRIYYFLTSPFRSYIFPSKFFESFKHWKNNCYFIVTSECNRNIMPIIDDLKFENLVPPKSDYSLFEVWRKLIKNVGCGNTCTKRVFTCHDNLSFWNVFVS